MLMLPCIIYQVASAFCLLVVLLTLNDLEQLSKKGSFYCSKYVVESILEAIACHCRTRCTNCRFWCSISVGVGILLQLLIERKHEVNLVAILCSPEIVQISF